jgi:peptide/nickel transport system permease protein
MVTLIGLQAGTMLGGSVVVESVFSLPGPRAARL